MRDYHLRLITKLNSRKVYLKRISRNYSNYRLFLFILEVITFFILFYSVSSTSAIISLAVFLIVISIIAHYHSKIEIGINKLNIWAEIKGIHLARITLDWDNIPPIDNITQSILTNEVDLDIVGNQSILQLINTATTKQSKSMLREWLNPKNINIDEINERQGLVKELIPLTIFRDKLTLYSMLSSRLEFNGDALNNLLANNEVLPIHFKITSVLLYILAPINLLLFALFLWNILPACWVITTLIYLLLSYYCSKGNERIIDEAESISNELGKIKGVFGFLEKYRYKKDSKLLVMCKPFVVDKQHPSFLINKLKSSVELLRVRKGNPFIWNMIKIVFPVNLYFNLKLKKYNNLIYGKFNIWLNIWYKLESLCSLANFTYLNPDYTFPKIIRNTENKIIFCGKQLGHPLIKNENKVCNDFSFNPDGEIALITGSNMSGKSTFIRALGINLSLAYAGSVVNANKLEVSRFDLFTCIRVNDSIGESISFFYAEVKRLKALLDEIERSEYPVFYLIDEIFRGTNNIERLKGSFMYIKKLAETNAVGAIATHDLELTNLSEQNIKVRNYHFKEEINNGEMTFDYLLSPGPCPTTNALIIMKLAGLPIEE